VTDERPISDQQLADLDGDPRILHTARDEAFRIGDLVAEVRRLRGGDWIERAAEEIAGNPHCCDISSSSATAMEAIIRKHVSGAREPSQQTAGAEPAAAPAAQLRTNPEYRAAVDQVIHDAEALEEELAALEEAMRAHRAAVKRLGNEQPTIPVNAGSLDRLLKVVRRLRSQQ
jgi:hypothetical protein